MARRGLRESARDIEKQLRAQIANDPRALAQLDKENADRAKQVKDSVQSEIPIDEGNAVGSIQVDKLRRTRDHPLPGRRVFSDDPKFHMIEYGTAADPEGTEEPRRVQIDGQWVTLDRNTPTEALAPFGKARARLGDRIE